MHSRLSSLANRINVRSWSWIIRGCTTAACLAMFSLQVDAQEPSKGNGALDVNAAAKSQGKSDEPKEGEQGWKSLISKDNLDGWEITNFGGEGSVEVKDGVLKLGRGDPLTGVTRTDKQLPKQNYEIRWQAMRVDGSDFFAGVTFPVGNEFCSFICGGWGGGLVGLSSIDGNDASENETSSYHQFKNNQWYSFRVRVDEKHITAWIDDKEVLQTKRDKRKFSLRAEVFKSKPLGYCVFQSIVDVRNLEIRTLP